MDIKLKKLIEDFALDHERPKVDKFKVTEAIRNYGRVGEALYKTNGIIEAAKQLSEMADAAQNHVLSETSDWFDSVSVKRNMKELKGLTGQFKKTAVEANATNQRLSALYEDMGNILNRYYEIDEALDKVDPSKVEPEDDYEDREDKDIDNDGDTDDSDEYLHKKRQAITKAIKKEDVNEDIDSQIDALMKQKKALMDKRPVPTQQVARISGKLNVLRDKKAKEKERNENITNLGDFLPKTLKEFGSPMDRALKQTLKDPKSGKEVTVGSIKNQGEKKYSPALVKKAKDIFKKAMEKEMATKKKIRKMQGD